MDLCELSPSYIRAIAPYQPGKPISELAREMGLDEHKIIKLASNENPLGLSPRARDAIEREVSELARYPDGNAFDLKGAIARRYNIAAERIVVGNGSNDLLELAAGAFLIPGSSAVYSQHAFAVYALATQARGARSIVVPARDYGHDLAAMAAAVTPDTRMLFVANPNNPTGSFVPGPELRAFIARLPRNLLVVLDEAYTEYLAPEQRYNAVEWLTEFPNLMIVRTFSKAYGLAGLRVGFGMMDPGVAGLLNRVRQPFNVNSLALAAAVAALEDQEFVAQSYAMNRAGMAQLQKGFRELGLAWIPSSGNFVSFELPKKNGASSAAAVYQSMLKRGVIVRPVAGYEMPDHLRVTVGTAEENTAFLAALGAALA